MVTSWILHYVEKDIAETLLYCDSAAEIWLDLKMRFAFPNCTRIFQVQKELFTLCQGNLSISAYFTRFKRLWDEYVVLIEIPSCGSCGATGNLPQFLFKLQVIQFLVGLNESYNLVRANILMMKPMPSIGETYRLVLEEEKQRELRSSPTVGGDSTTLNATQKGVAGCHQGNKNNNGQVQQQWGANQSKNVSYADMKLLRLLVLQKVELRDSAEQIGSLVLLRYLKIQWCSGTIPVSIRKLRNLLTFIYSGDGAEVKNNMFCNMEHFRHLSLTCGAISSSVLGVNKSRNLQSLELPAGKWLTNELRTVWVGLREMKLRGIHNQAQLEAVNGFVSNPSNRLHTLYLYLKEDSMLEYDLDKLKLEHCRLMKSLVLWGKVRRQQLPFFFPPNLLSLYLAFTEIENEEYLKGALAQLGQLRFLDLREESYIGARLTITGFPQLQELRLRDLPSLKEYKIKEGALPQLKRFRILHCYQLERIPIGISYIHCLQCFEALAMSNSLCKRLQQPSKDKNNDSRVGGDDFHLIQHIPSHQYLQTP